ncbi:MAG: anti-sigma factor, partial [Antricoccus sp.]
RRDRRSWRYWAGAAVAAVVIAVAAAGGGYLAGRKTDSSSTTVTASAALAQMPGGPAGVQGVATLHKTATGPRVSIEAASLPARVGYYEVWLYNPEANIMVAIGTLPQSGIASFPVPPGLDLDSFQIVDISAQNYDGDPVHQQSVLRGPLLS